MGDLESSAAYWNWVDSRFRRRGANRSELLALLLGWREWSGWEVVDMHGRARRRYGLEEVEEDEQGTSGSISVLYVIVKYPR